MIALQIRDVPEDVRDTLVGEAQARGTSLQGLLLGLVKKEAKAIRNREILATISERAGGYAGDAGVASAILEELREGHLQ